MAITRETPHSDATALRRRQPHETLNEETVRWLAALPEELGLVRLPAEYARIANELARRWAMPGDCLRYLDELVLDRRGSRRGFPLDVAIELSHLKSYYETDLHPTSQTVWDEITARARH